MPVTIASALLPVFGIIVAGLACRRAAFPGESFWQPAELLTYYVLFPALLVQKIAAPSPESSGNFSLIAALVVTTLIVTLLLLISRPALAREPAAFTSVFQGTVRFNTYIGLSIIMPLYGHSGIKTAAIVMATLIPLVNVLCVAVLSKYGSQTRPGTRKTLMAIIKNPVVLACLIGILLQVSGLRLSAWIDSLLEIMGRAALPLGLLCVGASLEFNQLGRGLPQIISSSFLRLALMPLLTWFICLLISVPHEAAAIAILFAALPGSALSFILARQLGGDSQLMAGIVTVQTCLSILTMPVVLLFLTKAS